MRIKAVWDTAHLISSSEAVKSRTRLPSLYNRLDVVDRLLLDQRHYIGMRESIEDLRSMGESIADQRDGRDTGVSSGLAMYPQDPLRRYRGPKSQSLVAGDGNEDGDTEDRQNRRDLSQSTDQTCEERSLCKTEDVISFPTCLAKIIVSMIPVC